MKTGEGLQENPYREDKKIAERWCEMNKARPPIEMVTEKGLPITIKTQQVNGAKKVEYLVYAENDKKIAWMYTGPIVKGWGRVTNATFYTFRDEEDKEYDYERRGVGTAVYNLIEEDIKKAGGRGLEPDWGSMSNKAKGFWQGRHPEANIEELNEQPFRRPGQGFEGQTK